MTQPNTTVTLINSDFINNASYGYGGGAVSAGENSHMTVIGSRFEHNTARVYGGAIDALQSTLFMSGTDVISNTVLGDEFGYGEGGGIDVPEVILIGGRFENNRNLATAGYGGGIRTSALDMTGTLFIHNTASEGGGAHSFMSNLNGGRFEGSISSGGWGGGLTTVYVSMRGTEFLSNTAHLGGGGMWAVGEGTISSGRFEGNRCTDLNCEGGGLYVAAAPGGSLALNNTTFIGNSAYAGGGISSNNPVTVIDSLFESNTARASGGAIRAHDTSVVMHDTQFISNTVLGEALLDPQGGGGGVEAQEITVIGGRFENNNLMANGSGSYGGGIYASYLIATDTLFINNSAPHGGGAWAGAATLANARFERNTATNAWGGGLETGPAFISNTSFLSNTSYYGGGGIAMNMGPSTLIGGRIENNRVLPVTLFNVTYGSGGGLWVVSNGLNESLLITGTQFVSNTAPLTGGGFYCDCKGFAGSPENVRMVNVVFAGNTAGIDGAAIGIDSAGNFDLVHTTIADTSLNPKAAILVVDAALNMTNTIITSHTVGISATNSTVIEDYNLFFGNITNALGVTSGGHSFIGDPKFADPLNDDYHLRLGSLAIDHGVDAGVYTDLDGYPRPIGVGFDIGAHEYQGVTYRIYLPVMRKT